MANYNWRKDEKTAKIIENLSLEELNKLAVGTMLRIAEINETSVALTMAAIGTAYLFSESLTSEEREQVRNMPREERDKWLKEKLKEINDSIETN